MANLRELVKVVAVAAMVAAVVVETAQVSACSFTRVCNKVMEAQLQALAKTVSCTEEEDATRLAIKGFHKIPAQHMPLVLGALLDHYVGNSSVFAQAAKIRSPGRGVRLSNPRLRSLSSNALHAAWLHLRTSKCFLEAKSQELPRGLAKKQIGRLKKLRRHGTAFVCAALRDTAVLHRACATLGGKTDDTSAAGSG